MIPKDVHNMVQYFFDGKVEESIKLQLDSIELCSALFSEVNPIPVKEACNMLSFECGVPRLPLTELTEEGKIRLKNSMKNYGLLK